MNVARRRRLAFHAVVVVTFGLFAGFPWAEVITSGSTSDAARAWRMAHLEGLLNGLLMLAVAGCGGLLKLSDRAAGWLVGSLVLAGYGNVIASIVGALSGERGLAPGGSGANWFVFLLFMAAVLAVFVAMGMTAWGTRPGALEE